MKIDCMFIRNQMERDVVQLKEILSKNQDQSSLDDGATSWINGLINILESKVMVQSNVDDLLWFYENGLNQCRNVLDLGCGGGYITLLLSRIVPCVTGYEYVGKWVGQQYSETSYKKGFSFSHSAIRHISGGVLFHFYQSFPLSIPDGAMDSVILYAVLEHLHPSVQKSLMAEVWRILRPGGHLFIAKLPRILSYQEHLARLLGLGSHDCLYSKRMAKEFLEENGFRVLRIGTTGLFFNHPNKVVNKMFPLTSRLERYLSNWFPPINIFSHDYRISAIKP